MNDSIENSSFFHNSAFFSDELKFIDDDTSSYSGKSENFRCDSSSKDDLKSFDGTQKIPQTYQSSTVMNSSLSAHRSLPRHKDTAAGGGSPLLSVQGYHHPTLVSCRDDSSLSGLRPSVRQTESGSSYELSSDFQQKQLEILERKYGGSLRSRRAAIIIQRAYRKYKMVKKFEHLRKRRTVVKMISSVDVGHCRTPFVRPIMTINVPPNHQNGQFLSPLNDSDDPRQTMIGRQSDSALISGGGARLKLHRYNVGGRTHLSAPLSAQLRAEQMQMERDNYQIRTDNYYHNQSPVVSSVIRVKLNDAGSVCDRNSSAPQSKSSFSNHSSSTSRHRSISMERNQYAATTALNVVSAPTTSTSIKILSNESEIFNSSMSPTHEFGSKIVTYSSYVGEQTNSSQFFYPPSSSANHYVGAVASGSNVGHRHVGGGGPNQFHPTVKLSKKLPVHHTNSADSVQDLCTPSSDSGVSSGPGGHQPYSATNSADNSPRRFVVFNSSTRSTTTPIWVPRQDKRSMPIIAIDAQASSKLVPPVYDLQASQASQVDVHASTPADGQEPSCSSRNPVEPQLNHWARRSLTINSSVRRTDVERKRQYRIALNFFNKKPERGVNFLIKWNFVEGTPIAVAKFLISRKGISKQMIGEYLGNLQNSFNMAVLDCFVNEVNLHNMEIDTALRHFQSLFRLPGEAQKIERIVEVFARRYCECNPEHMKMFKQADTVFILSFAIIMLNTDLHSPNVKPERRMKCNDFIKNLRGIDAGGDINAKFLTDLYNRVRENEFKPGSDHVTQVLKVERSVEGKRPTLAMPHRRLVCYCRLYEVMDPAKKQPVSAHQREVFLFNDMLMITKILSKKKNVVVYNYRQSHCLVGMQVQAFRNQHFSNGLRINHTLENKILHFNARNEEDRTKFVEDLHEAILESDEMEALRINMELEKQSYTSSCRSHSLGRNEQQRDSGLGDLELDRAHLVGGPSAAGMRKKAVSNSLLDVADNGDRSLAPSRDEAMRRRASGTSLDSGMSSTASIGSRESSPLNSRPTKLPVDDTATFTASEPLEPPKSAGTKSVGFSFAEFFGTKKPSKNQPINDSTSTKTSSDA